MAAGRYLGRVKFVFEGNKLKAQQLEMYARGLIQKELTPLRVRRNRKQYTRNYKFNTGTIIRFQITFNTIICTIFVPTRVDKLKLGPAAFVIYPYVGWLYPAYRDKRRDGTNILIQDVPSYYMYRVRPPLPSKAYWFDPQYDYDPEKPTTYEIEKCKPKATDDQYDPMLQQTLDDGDNYDRDNDDHYSSYGHWNNDDFYLQWQDSYGGDLIEAGVSTWREIRWGKFVYVNGVKFPAPNYVRGAAVYHDEDTNSDWLVISTWVEADYLDCLYDARANLYMTRLFTGPEDNIPTATNDGDVTTTTELYNAIQIKDQADIRKRTHDWFPVGDDKDGYTLPEIATLKGSYSPTCGTLWPDKHYIIQAWGFKFNQSCTRHCYVCVIEGVTANQFEEFTLSFFINSADGILIPDTFSKTLSASDYANATIQGGWDNRLDGDLHEYQTAPMTAACAYKGDVLRKITCKMQAKFVPFADRDNEIREMYIYRTWYLDGQILCSQSTTKIFAGLNWSDRVWQYQTNEGSSYIYYDLATDDYVKEEYEITNSGNVYGHWYKRTIQVADTIISVDEGTHDNLVYLPNEEERPGWPMDGIGKWPWQMHGSIITDQFYGAGYNNTNDKVIDQVLATTWADKVAIGYFWMGGGGPGQLNVSRGHERGHLMGTYVSRSVNAGDNGIYFIDTPSPYEYELNDSDHRFRVQQNIFVFGVEGANKLYKKFGVQAGTDNTVPLITTSFYRRTSKWNDA